MREIKHLSVHQWLRSAIPDSQQPTSPIGFLFLKLPPPPCAVVLEICCGETTKNHSDTKQEWIIWWLFHPWKKSTHVWGWNVSISYIDVTKLNFDISIRFYRHHCSLHHVDLSAGGLNTDLILHLHSDLSVWNHADCISIQYIYILYIYKIHVYILYIYNTHICALCK